MLGVFKKVNQYLIALLVISKVVFITNKDIVFTALQNYNATGMNEFFFELEESFRNIYCETWPEFDPEIEKLLYKDSSDYYQRRKIILFTERMIEDYKKADTNDVSVYFKFLEKFLNDCIDYLDENGNVYDEGRKEKAKSFVDKYKLSIEDIALMKSVIRHRKQDKSNEIYKMLVSMEK